MPSRQLQIGSVKSLFDELIDRHAEAYQAEFPEVKEFSNFDKSGTFNYYIGMVWTNDNERPDTEQLRVRGSLNLSKNKILELDLSAVDAQQSFFPGQIVAFQADPYLKHRLTVKKFLDPMRIAPKLKHINTLNNINLMIACGPYLKSDPSQSIDSETWDTATIIKIVESFRANNGTHLILIGPFVDFDNKQMRAHYDVQWRKLFERIVEGLHDYESDIYVVPSSSRDILPCSLNSNFFYPTSKVEYKLKLKEGAKPKCNIHSITDPAQIDLGGIFVDVTSVEVLFHLNQCISFINKAPSSQFNSIYRHIITHGIYPIYPPPSNELAIDYPQLREYIHLDRLAPHIIVLPSRFNVSTVTHLDDRLIVTINKCSMKKHALMVEIPKTESSSPADQNWGKSTILDIN